jgi:hypothetical protein
MRFACGRHKYSRALHKITETAGLIKQVCADEMKIKLASLLAVLYSLLFVAFSLILLFIVIGVCMSTSAYKITKCQ